MKKKVNSQRKSLDEEIALTVKLNRLMKSVDEFGFEDRQMNRR